MWPVAGDDLGAAPVLKITRPGRYVTNLKGPGWLVPAVLLGVVAWGSAAWAGPVKVYMADEEGDTVTVLDATSFARLATIPVGREPHNVQVSPDGRWAWVTVNADIEPKTKEEEKHPATGMSKREHEAMSEIGQVWVIETATDQVVAKVLVGKHPAHVVLAPDGRLAFVTNGGENTVSVVDATDRKVIGTIPVGAYPHGIRVSPDGREAYVANLKGGAVSVIDTEARREVATIAVGKGPAQVGFTPGGNTAFVSLSQENAVAIIDPVSRTVVKKVPVGTVPIQVFSSPDSHLLLVANQGSKKTPGRTVSMIDLGRLKVVKTLQTGPGAHGVVVTKDGYAFVTNTYGNTVSVIEIAGLKVVATVPVGKGPNGISVTP